MKVDLSGPLKVSLDKELAEARALEADGKAAEAAQAFKQSAKLMNSFADYALTRGDQLRRREKAQLYLRHAEALLSGKAPSRQPTAGPAAASGKRAVATPSGDVREDGTEPDLYSREIAGLIHRSKVTWDEIGGLDATKREIKFTYGLALAKKPEGMRLAGWRRMLFYGPPGTGKTLLAAATSNGLGATFFNVRVSNLLSKYFGESSKLVSALFDAARSEADEGFAVVFIDEVESLCLQRGDGSDSGAERRVLSTLLSELDGLADKGEDRFVLTVAATNAPWDLDEAVLSRFQKRIFIPLPDAAARRSILDIRLAKDGHVVEVSLEDVVRRTEWFSGRDLDRLANQAVNVMVEELNGAIPQVVDEGRDRIRDYAIKVRPLTMKDFEAAFQRVRVDAAKQQDADRKYREFAESN